MATLVQPKLAVVLDLLSDKFDTGLAKSESRLGSFGKTAGKVGLLAAGGIAAAGVAIGGTLLKIGTDYDAMQDTIRIGTGLTGKALDQMSQDAAAVFASIPTSWDKVGQAFSQLHERTGETGADLSNLAKTELELARLTGTDLSTNITQTTRLFGDWGIAAKDQVGALDELFRATQATGVGVSDLSALMVRFGSPLRQLGFSFDEAAALLGKFEKEGVNTELVTGSLRIALGKMAKEGITDPPKALEAIIKKIKEAGSVGKANALALEYFGARAGPDMAAAIREGRFEVGKLFDQIKDGKDTVLGAARDTNDWRQNLQILTNSLQVLLLPAANAVFNALNRLVLLITGPILRATKLVTRGVREMTAWFALFRTKGLNPVSAALRAFGTWLEHFRTGNKTLDRIVNDLGHAIAYLAQSLHNLLSGNPEVALIHLQRAFGFLWDAIVTGFNAVPWQAIGDAIWGGLQAAFAFAVQSALPWLAQRGWDLIVALWQKIDWGAVGRTIWDGIKTAVRWVVAQATGAGNWLATEGTKLGRALWDIDWAKAGKDLWDGVKLAVAAAVGQAAGAASWLAAEGYGLLKGLWALDWKKVATDIWNGLWTAAQAVGKLGAVAIDAVLSLGGDLAELKKDAGGFLHTLLGWGDTTVIHAKRVVIEGDVSFQAKKGAEAAAPDLQAQVEALLGRIPVLLGAFFIDLPNTLGAAIGQASTTTAIDFLEAFGTALVDNWQVAAIALGAVVLGILAVAFGPEVLAVAAIAAAALWVEQFVAAFLQNANWGAIGDFLYKSAQGWMVLVGAGLNVEFPNLYNDGRDVVSWIWTGIASLLDWFGIAVHAIPNAVIDTIAAFGGWFYDAGRDIVSGIWDGIASLGGWLYDQVAGFIENSILGPVKSKLGIGSPSKAMAAIGEDAARGLAVGIGDGLPTVARAVDRVTGALLGVGTPRMAAAGAGAAGMAAAAGAAVGRGPIALTVNVNGANMTNDQVADAVSAAIMRRMRYIQAGA